MQSELLTADELLARIQCGVRTIREQLSSSALLERLRACDLAVFGLALLYRCGRGAPGLSRRCR